MFIYQHFRNRDGLGTFLFFLFLRSGYVIALLISTVKRRVLIFLWRICERYEPCTFTWKSHLSSLLDKDGSFMEMYRATALQRGKSFPSCAWRMPLLHRDFSLAFALDFLTTFYDNDFWFISQQSQFLTGSFWTSAPPQSCTQYKSCFYFSFI